MKKTVNFRFEENIINGFQKRYPYCLTRFLLHCIKLAISDKSFFEGIYFKTFDEVEK